MRNLETARLWLRPFTEADYPAVYAISSDPETTRYLFYWGHPGVTPEQDARRFLRRAIDGFAENPVRCREYALVRKADGAVIGDGSIELLDAETAEIGWILLPAYRGQGYAREMGEELMRRGFETLGVKRVIAHCDARNAPSYHLMERLGMRLERLEKEARPAKTPGGTKGDECTYALDRAQWEEKQNGIHS